MATRKTEPKAENEILAEAPAEEVPAVEAAVDPWEEYEDMMVRRKRAGEADSYYVCVNDRRFYIPRDGKVQKIPKPIAEVLRASLAAEEDAEAFSASIPNG